MEKNTSRDLQNGQYKFTTMTYFCKCGHELGEHTAERNAKEKQHECLEEGCSCTFFTKVKKSK